MNAREIVKALAERGINTVSSLREFGIFDFDAKGVRTAVRLSPHYYNTFPEIDGAVAALAEILAWRSQAAVDPGLMPAPPAS